MPVLFFDGECILCNAMAGWVAKQDTTGSISFASLQSKYAKERLPPALWGVTTLVFIEKDRILTRSTAVFEILKYLPAWRVCRLLRFLPGKITDGLYDQVAARRLQWFGKATACAVLPAGLQKRCIPDAASGFDLCLTPETAAREIWVSEG